MALNDTFIKNSTKHSGKPTGDKHSDGGGLYLHVKASGKYWRMDYAIHGKRKTLAIGVYPAVGLAQARKARDAAKAQLSQGVDPSTAKREAKQASTSAAQNTFEAVALAWLKATAHKRDESTGARIERRLQIDVFPEIGRLPIVSNLVKHQLAHTVKDANGRAYNRTAHLPARREMMQRWADYLDRLCTGADIIQLHSKAA